MPRCLLLNPEFRSDSFWNYRETCQLRGARYPSAPLGLITVAAMLPQEWDIRLFDGNVKDWDPSAAALCALAKQRFSKTTWSVHVSG